jgi:hypothetical protein
VVVVLGERRLDAWTDTELFTLKSLLYWSLGTVFLALVPSGLSSLSEHLAHPWRVAHGVFALFHAGVFFWFFRQVRRLEFPLSRTKSGLAILTVGFGVLFAEVLVALGVVTSTAPFLYLVALLWFLFLAARSFAALVFPPTADPPAA